jgi:predicted ATPase
MITRLSLKNFGPYENTSVTFEDFTVILGPNGAGKSLLFSALKCIGRVAKFPLRSNRPGPHLEGYPMRTGQVTLEELLHRGDTNRTLVLSVEFKTGELSGSYVIHLKHWQNPGGTLVEEHLQVKTPKGELKVVAHPDGSVESPLTIPKDQLATPRFVSIPGKMYRSRDPEEAVLGQQIQEAFWDHIGIFRFDPTALKTPSEIGRQKLSPTGYNFATYLDEIRNEPGGTEEFQALLGRFKSVCPHVEDVLLPIVQEPGGGGAKKRLAMVMSGKQTIPAELESDGSVLLLAYASLLHGSRPYETICIEEPENGIHPKVIERQVRMLEALTKPYAERPGAQVLICTHSRPFFDVVKEEPKALRLVRRGGDGRSTVESVPAQLVPSIAGWAGLA